MHRLKALLAARGLHCTQIVLLSSLLAASCSIAARLPVVRDPAIETLVRRQASRIIAVADTGHHLEDYSILLSDFPRSDILGMSIGNRRIYISYALGKLAARDSSHLWLLRQTLAHEIAHEMLGHAKQTQVALNAAKPARGVTGSDVGLPWLVRYRNYSPQTELQADLEGMKYWAELNWDCRIWVRLLKGFQVNNYAGDDFHPTEERLRQAAAACPAQRNTAAEKSNGR